VILAIRPSQSTVANRFEIKGTPKYLTRRKPSDTCRKSKSALLAAEGTPAKNKELLAWLDFNPESSSNSTKTSLITLRELKFAAEKMSKSSAKQRWENLKEEHLGWNLKSGWSRAETSNNRDKTFMAKTKKVRRDRISLP
jgi:hypothetical protein